MFSSLRIRRSILAALLSGFLRHACAVAGTCNVGRDDLETASCLLSDDASFIQAASFLDTAFAQAENAKKSSQLIPAGLLEKQLLSSSTMGALTLGVGIMAFVCAVAGASAMITSGSGHSSALRSPTESPDTAASSAPTKVSWGGSAGTSPSAKESKSPTMLQKVGQSTCCSPTSQAAQQRAEVSPSLSGKWLMSKTEGGVDTFLEELGVGWFSRSLAMAASYGAGRHTMEFRLTGDVLDVTESKMASANYTWHIGGGWQRFEGQAGPAMTEPFWDIDGISVTANCKGLDGQHPFITTFKLLSINEIVEIDTSQSGRQAKFYYKRLATTPVGGGSV